VPRVTSAAEFREVMDRVLTMMREDPQVSSWLRAARAPLRLEFTGSDPALHEVVHIRAGGTDKDNLEWTWGVDVPWEPVSVMAMSPETAIRYFQGRENLTMALARRRIRPGGDLRTGVEALRVVKAVFPRFRAMLEAEYPHLAI
jgi:hypothetical protein